MMDDLKDFNIEEFDDSFAKLRLFVGQRVFDDISEEKGEEHENSEDDR